MAIDAVQSEANDQAEQQPRQYIRKIVDTEVKTGPAIEQAPSYQGESKNASSKNKGNKGGYGHRITGMAGEKAIASASVSVYYIYQMGYLWIVGRTVSSYKWFENT